MSEKKQNTVRYKTERRRPALRDWKAARQGGQGPEPPSSYVGEHGAGQESDRIFYFPPAKKKIKIPTSTGSVQPPRDLSPQHCHTSKFQGPLSCNRERKHKNKPCVCLQDQLSLWSLFHLSLSHSSSYSWPKGVSMPALLHGMSKKGKKKKNLMLAYVLA